MHCKRAAVEVERRVHIVARLHVHPDDGFFFRPLDNGIQMFEAEIRRKIQPELRQFDGNLRL